MSPVIRLVKKPAGPLRTQGGFTLLELLIVIVIVGILAFLIVPSITSGPQKARDAQRKHDLSTIKSALETYYNDSNSYPSSQATANAPTCVASQANCLGNALTGGSTPYLKTIPSDPKNSGPYVYTYSPTPSGCGTGACTSYTLTAQLENTSDAQAGAGGVYTVNSAN
ncbi:MAG TPA: type II secretion system protein GspG [Candidatus Saccharimonadales bacterium]|nr:type II secretion system protein GspG [Candidatus Saccharimonadales bacterium]